MDINTSPVTRSQPPPIEFECSDLTVRLDVRLPGDPAAITPVVDSVLSMARQMKCAEGRARQRRDRQLRALRARLAGLW